MFKKAALCVGVVTLFLGCLEAKPVPAAKKAVKHLGRGLSSLIGDIDTIAAAPDNTSQGSGPQRQGSDAGSGSAGSRRGADGAGRC